MINEIFKFYPKPALPENWLGLFVENVMPIISIVFFAILLMLEMIPARHKLYKSTMLRSYRTNIFMFIFNNIFLSLLSISSLLLLAERYHHNEILDAYNYPVQLVVAFILFDLMLYIWHWANHHYDVLWMFHKVHHSDRSMNVSTAFRVHFIEVLLTTLLKALFIITLGVEAAVVAVCEAVSMLFAMFHHLSFSFRNEKWLKWFIIVPAMHRIHHSSLRKEHDSNYGAIFSIWDRLFRTASESLTGEIGLNNIEALNFLELLRFGMIPVVPVSAQLQAANTTVTVNPALNMDAMIAEAAYFIAEKRSFVAGCELHDWFEAEQQINECEM